MLARPVNNAPGTAGAVASVSDSYFQQVCRELGLTSRLEQILLIEGSKLLTCGKATDPDLVNELKKRVLSTWDDETQTAQIQYFQLDKYDEPLMLFTRPVGGFLLTLVTQAKTSVGLVSSNADSLSIRLLRDVGAAPENGRAAREIAAYAIAWRPVKPMSRDMRQAVQVSARRLARENGCYLTFVGVASDHVHLVMHCPAHRSSSWAAHAFKNGIQEDVRRQFEITVELWHKGFLASSSAEPLAGEELLTYLSSDL